MAWNVLVKIFCINTLLSETLDTPSDRLYVLHIARIPLTFRYDVLFHIYYYL